MTDASPLCASCHRRLGSDDRFCPRCGTPTPINDDPAATIINPATGGRLQLARPS